MLVPLPAAPLPLAQAIYNGAFSTIAFLAGAITSIISGFLGMKIATYANARTALEARKGVAPAFMAGASGAEHRG
jgi:H+-translocating diphosphatase